MYAKATLIMLSIASLPTQAEVTITLGADLWLADTKVNEVRQDAGMVPILYSAIAHDISYLPNAQIRYLSLDEDYMALNKLDLSIYYPLLNHDLLHFDAGVTFTDLSNTKYVNPENGARADFNKLIWAWYAYAEITLPNSHWDVIGEMNFGDSSGIKNTDLMAGMQYRVPMGDSPMIIKAGYRVIDMESKDFPSSKGDPMIFANGFFAGAEYSF